jgi:tetratricopeptide (TPR) repeat protein
MTRQTLVLSANYRAVVRAIRELHRLNQAGLEESPEADAIRDAHDAAWEALSEAERRRIGGLSEDLYSLSELPPNGAQPLNPQAQTRLNDAFEARQLGDWDRALELLRRWSKHLSPALVSFLRGTIWRDAGDAETAVPFLEHATHLEPDNANYLMFFLTVLDAVDPVQARQRADAIIREADRFPPGAAVRAAHILLSAVPPPPKPELSRRLIPVLDGALARIKKGDEGGLDRQSCVNALALLGVCYETLGNVQAAAECYSQALQLDPHDQSLLLARGVLLYGSPGAIADLQLAIQNGCRVFLPYFLLAHDALVNRDYPRCLSLCDRAMQQDTPPSFQSELAEWTAIAQAELGKPPDIVRASFERALRLDPSNDRARRNLARFDAALASAHRVAWEARSAAAVRASGQAERRYAVAA